MLLTRRYLSPYRFDWMQKGAVQNAKKLGFPGDAFDGIDVISNHAVWLPINAIEKDVPEELLEHEKEVYEFGSFDNVPLYVSRTHFYFGSMGWYRRYKSWKDLANFFERKCPDSDCWFIKPAEFAGVSQAMRIGKDEIPG